MRPFSKITLQQRNGYREVFIYYSRHGVKFRESTTVKIVDREVFNLEGTVTENSNLEIIRKTHRQVEDIVLGSIRENREKPPVQWLRLEFDKVKLRNLSFPESPADVPPAERIEGTSASDEAEFKSDDAHDDLFFHW